MPENLMNVMQHPLTVVVLAYLLGSLSFAVIVSKFMACPILVLTAVRTQVPPMFCDLATKKRQF